MAPGSESDGVDRATVDTTEEPSGGEDRPEWLPEKFDSPEEMAKSYTELESKLGSGESPDGGEEEEPDEDMDPSDLEINQEETEEAAEEADFDLNEIGREYAENGEVSEESYEAFEEQTGLSRDALDRHIEGQKAVAREATRRLAEVVGGTEALQRVLDWAAGNVSESQAAKFNEAAQSGDFETAEMALRAITQQYQEAEGTEPSLTTGAPSGAPTGTAPFKSSAEVTEAMSDERYKTDPAYRQKVADRLAKSELF